MTLKWIARATYGSPAVNLDFEFTLGVWEPGTHLEGGARVLPSGLQEAYVRREDGLVNVTIRFFEYEWPAVDAWLRAVIKSGASFTWMFDRNDATTQRTVYLDSPRPNDRIQPRRNAQYPGQYLLDITLRTTDGTRFDIRRYLSGTPYPEKVTVAPASWNIDEGATQQLTATVRDNYGNVMAGESITWASSNPAVATVNASGLVTAVAPGQVTITATARGIPGHSAGRIARVPVATVTLTPDPFTVAQGGTRQMTATARDASNNILSLSGRTVIWSSSNPSVMTVNGSGLVTGVAAGSATITVSVDGIQDGAAGTVPAPGLLNYTPGDSLAAFSPVRSTAATYHDSNGIVQTAGINVARDDHYIGGVRHLLLERGITNRVLYSQPANAAQGANSNSGTPGLTFGNGPFAGLSGWTHYPAGASWDWVYYETDAPPDGAIWTVSCYVRMLDGGVPVIADGPADAAGDITLLGPHPTSSVQVYNTHKRVEHIGGGTYRISARADLTGGTPNAAAVGVFKYSGNSGRGFYATGFSLTRETHVSSYIPAAGAPTARGADGLSRIPAGIEPQEMTVYLDETIKGANTNPGGIDTRFSLGSNYYWNSARFFGLFHDGLNFYIKHWENVTPAAGIYSGSALADANIHRRHETVAQLKANGDIQGNHAWDGGAEVVGANIAGQAFASPWGVDALYIGNETYPAFMAIRRIKILTGVQDLAAMRAA